MNKTNKWGVLLIVDSLSFLGSLKGNTAVQSAVKRESMSDSQLSAHTRIHIVFCTHCVFVSPIVDINPFIFNFSKVGPYIGLVQKGTAHLKLELWDWLYNWLVPNMHYENHPYGNRNGNRNQDTMLQWFSPLIVSVCVCVWHQRRGRPGETAGGSKLSSKINQKKEKTHYKTLFLTGKNPTNTHPLCLQWERVQMTLQ